MLHVEVNYGGMPKNDLGAVGSCTLNSVAIPNMLQIELYVGILPIVLPLDL